MFGQAQGVMGSMGSSPSFAGAADEALSVENALVSTVIAIAPSGAD